MHKLAPAKFRRKRLIDSFHYQRCIVRRRRKITYLFGITTHFMIMDYCSVVGANSERTSNSPRPRAPGNILTNVKIVPAHNNGYGVD